MAFTQPRSRPHSPATGKAGVLAWMLPASALKRASALAQQFQQEQILRDYVGRRVAPIAFIVIMVTLTVMLFILGGLRVYFGITEDNGAMLGLCLSIAVNVLLLQRFYWFLRKRAQAAHERRINPDAHERRRTAGKGSSRRA